ncbi:MAG: hypothetical protein JXQ76_04315, partial [Campylobacterales bacterium]|nr:hypothetical protein [Campylobacterales bacterium]
MTIKEAILESLKELKKLSTYNDVSEHIIKNSYYPFEKGKTPSATISSSLGDFIRNNDERVKRIKGERGIFLYYLAIYEEDLNLNIDDATLSASKKTQTASIKKNQTYRERDLHTLLSSYLKNKNIYAKTILHEESKNSKDDHQKWIHPDMIGIEFLNLNSSINKAFMKIINKS